MVAASFIRPDLADTIKQQMRNLTDQWKDALENERLYADIPTESARVSQELANLKKQTLDTFSQSIISGGESLAATFTDGGHEEIRQLTENMSAAMDLGMHSGNFSQPELQNQLHGRLAGAHNFSNMVEEANQTAARQFDENKLAELIGQTNEALVSHLSEKLNPLVNQLGQAAGRSPDPNFQRQLAQTIANELRQAISNPGAKSLRGIIQSSFANFGSRIAKEWGLHQISTVSLSTAISQAQRQTVPQQPNIVVNTDPTTPPIQSPATPSQPASSTSVEAGADDPDTTGQA